MSITKIYNISITPKTNSRPITSPLPKPRATAKLLSLCVDFPLLDISYTWNHMICDFLCLTIFSFSNFKDHPCYSMYQ